MKGAKVNLSGKTKNTSNIRNLYFPKSRSFGNTAYDSKTFNINVIKIVKISGII